MCWHISKSASKCADTNGKNGINRTNGKRTKNVHTAQKVCSRQKIDANHPGIEIHYFYFLLAKKLCFLFKMSFLAKNM